MRILKVYDRTLSLRATAQECGCSHHTVASYVQKRALGQLGEPVRRPRLALIDPHRPLIEELVQQSRGRIRADKCHQRLMKLGYTGSERTTRRAVAKARQAYKKQNRRVFRPWITEPGKWAQWDWAKGPPVNGEASWLFCAWLSWSRYRVVLPARDRKLETLVGCLTEAQSYFGGVPCNWLTDNEKTVSTEFVASIAVRHPLMVGFGRFHGCAIATCQVADPATKGGSEATVKIAKADLVPTDHNLLPHYSSWNQLADAGDQFMRRVNARAHSITKRPPVEMLAIERDSLHPLPGSVFSVALGKTRTVSDTALVAWRSAWYSVPHIYSQETVWVRERGDMVIVSAQTEHGVVEVARHRKVGRGRRVVVDSHYTKTPPGPLNRQPRPRNQVEKEFLGIGPGAALWLRAACAAGSARLKEKLEEIVQLAHLDGCAAIDAALGVAAEVERFGFGDIAAIAASSSSGPRYRASEDSFLQDGTGRWQDFGAGGGDR